MILFNLQDQKEYSESKDEMTSTVIKDTSAK